MEKTFKVSIQFDSVTGKTPLGAAKIIAKWLKDSADEMIFDIIDETTNEAFTVDLSEEEEENAVLANKETSTINAYQLHDHKSEEIIGTVFIQKPSQITSDEIFSGWEKYNKEYEEININSFVEWFNENHLTKIGVVNMDFIQPS